MHAIQLARAPVCGFLRRSVMTRRLRWCGRWGAHPINYRTESFRQVIQRESAGHGVNYILDVVGREVPGR